MRSSIVKGSAAVLLSTTLLGGCLWPGGGGGEKREALDALRASLEKAAPGETVSVGEAVIRTSLAGTPYQGPQAMIYKTERVQGPMPTGDWWSSAAWVPYTSALYPWPLAAKGTIDGLGLAAPEMRAGATRFHALYNDGERDLLIGGAELKAEDVRVDGFGDWSVDLLFENAEKTKRMRATLSHGGPYAYFTFEGTSPRVTFPDAPTVFTGGAAGGSAGSAVLGVTVGDRHYALFAPSGSSWRRESPDTYVVDAAGSSPYLSVALLPDDRPETLQTYAKYAYAFITDTRVAWSYDEKDGQVVTTFTAETKAMEGKESGTIFALFPHQWKHVDAEAALLPYTYASPRGTMKTTAGSSFQTVMAYRGMLPYLPIVGADKAELNRLLDGFMLDAPLVKPSPEAEGTYWYGKNYGRLTQVLPLAEQLGRADDAAAIRDAIRQDMETAFTDGTGGNRIVYYDRTWGTLNLYPTGFGADIVLNDHHFHYGYWVYSAALLAYADPAWASDSRFGGMIDLLIRDYANWSRKDRENRAAASFPFLRQFDPYEGHSWASGNAADGNGYSPGNNQESSSEAVLAAAAMILWGDATGNRELRDAGIYLYTTETEAIGQYWYDVDGDNFPEGYEKSYLPIVFSSGGEYRTWWTNNPEEVRLINALPITAASLYLGWAPENAKRNHAEMVEENGGPAEEWRDLAWMYEALFDPEAAMGRFTEAYEPEYGESKPHTYQWLSALRALGAVDPGVTADAPMFAAFRKEGVSTYMAFNGSDKARIVTFKEIGTGKVLHRLEVPPHQLATGQG